MAELKKFLFDNFIIGACDTKLPEPLPDIVAEPEPIVEDVVEVVDEVDSMVETIIEIPAEPTFSKSELDAQVAKASQEGYDRGYAKSQKEIAAESNVLMKDIEQKLSIIFAQSAQKQQEQEQEVLQVIKQALLTLVPTLLEDNAVTLVDKFLQDNFNNFKHNEKLSFYINPDIISYIQDSIVKLANSNDFEGKISIHKDSSLERCSCRVEWDNGGVEYSPSEQLEQIGKMLDKQ